MNLLPVPRVGVIVVAGGSGTRLGSSVPKAFVGLDQDSMLIHCLRGVLATGLNPQIVLVVPAGREGEALADAERVAGDAKDLITVVAGGETRQQSVAAGLDALWVDIEVVLVHDAARALTPPDVFTRVVAAVDELGWGVVPVLPVIDTIKRVDGAEVVGVVDRNELAAAQTPQGFRRDVLESAYQVAREEFTDDAALVQAAGHRIATVAGSAKAFKITTPTDLDRARTLVAQRATGGQAPEAPRVGIGTDVHAFADTGTLWLAGLEWPGERALAGHSDGDAVAHAIVDALLSAAGAGDIGSRFGTDRPDLAGAHADVFLAETARIVADAGWRIGNVAVQVQAKRPIFASRRVEAERVLSRALGAQVSVSATTTDGLGFVGEQAGVQAFAVALLLPA